VIVPVHDRPEELARCLERLRGLDVVVVDDGSADAPAHAAVAARYGARLVRRDDTGGPAAARMAGLAATSAPIVVFVDSDVVAEPAVLRSLLAHFVDASVGAVAPRIRPLDSGTGQGGVLQAFAAVRSPLDMGPEPARVGPGTTVPYVPTTVLAVRRAAVAAVGGFDASLRYGEDVDLVWRLADAGWTVRYDPAQLVEHAEPDRWPTWLARRMRYGSAAGALERRHPGRLAPLRVSPAPMAVLALAALGRPRAAGALHVAVLARVLMRLRASGVPPVQGLRPAVTAPAHTLVGVGRWVTQLGWPLLPLLARRRPRLAGGLVAAPLLVEWVSRRPRLDPARYAAAVVADDAAYGTGVWVGALRARSLRPVLPVVGTRARPGQTSDDHGYDARGRA
jgi:mycofactocin system glycosyltransferase